MPRLPAVLTALVTAAFVLSPAVFGQFGGYEPSQFPIPQDSPKAQPAGYAFAIWGLIYAWLAVSAGVGLWRHGADGGWTRTRRALIASLGPGALWIGIAMGDPVWATVLIFWMLATAIAALFATPLRDRWVLQVPVALYAGWLTAASFVSLALIGAGYGVLTGETGWAIITLIGVLAVGITVQTRLRRAPAYGIAIVWALIGVAVNNITAAPTLGLLALIGAAIMGVTAWRCRETV